MEIGKDFTTSFNELKKHKVIIIPTLLSLIIPSILILLFLNVSGIYDLSKGLVDLAEQYNGEKEKFLFENPNLSDKNYTVELIHYIGQSDEYQKGFNAYLERKGYDWNAWLSLINTRNIALLVVFILAISAISFYLSCASFALITLNIKNKELNLSNTLGLTNRFLFSLLSLGILSFLIIGLPILLGILIVVLIFFVNVLLGGIFTFLLIIGAVVYIIFIALRLFFSTPIMFIEEQKASDSIKISYNITKHHLKQVFIIFAIIYGVTLFINGFVGSPLYDSFISLLTTGSVLKFVILLSVVLLFLLLEAFMLAFENMFFFYSYLDFKKITAGQEFTKSSDMYAGFWIRFSAMAWDLLILGMPSFIAQFLLVFATRIQSTIYLVSLAIFAITIYMDGIKGGTPGKLLLGLRIINEKGKYVGIPVAILRYIGKMLSGLIFGIGYLMIAWNPKKQGLHDKLAKTFVVKTSGIERRGLTITGIILGFLWFIFIISIVFLLLSRLTSGDESKSPKAYYDHIQSAKTLWAVGDYNRVIKEGELALNNSKTDQQKSGAHYWIGIGYYRLGNLDAAQQHEELAISLDSESSGPYVTLGAIMLDKGNIPKAKELAIKAVDMDNSYSWAHNLLGLVLNAEGQKEQAILEIKKAIELEPLNEVFKQNLKYVEGNE